jgi:glycine dehydrogenase subunit 2
MSTINQQRLASADDARSRNSRGCATFTGNRALMLEEALIFEIGALDTTGVDFAEAPKAASRLGGLERAHRDIGLARA